MGNCIEHTQKGLRGYGHKAVRGRTAIMHRAVYAEAHGLDVFTMGGVVMHSCDNQRCINPEHLIMGTHRANMADMVAKGRQSKGARHNSTLTDVQIAEIRRRYVPQCRVNGGRALAREFGIDQKSITNYMRGTHR